jgi:hypothetical protein
MKIDIGNGGQAAKFFGQVFSFQNFQFSYPLFMPASLYCPAQWRIVPQIP